MRRFDGDPGGVQPPELPPGLRSRVLDVARSTAPARREASRLRRLDLALATTLLVLALVHLALPADRDREDRVGSRHMLPIEVREQIENPRAAWVPVAPPPPEGELGDLT